MSSVRDRVTIALFGKQQQSEFTTLPFREKENILTIKMKFEMAARKAGREPPEIILSLLLIPDWTQADNGYEHADYLRVKKSFFSQAIAEFKSPGIEVQDFYQEAKITEDEKQFMHGLSSGGSNLDIMKTRAILDNHNCRHLQIDSNAKIYSYEKLYQKTFQAVNQSNALYACLYTWYGISANNKVIYTIPDGKIAVHLQENYLAYCEKNKNSVVDKGAYLMYDSTFPVALSSLGLTEKIVMQYDRNTQKKIFYQAKTEDLAYRITEDIIGAVNMSWSTNNTTINTLLNLPTVTVGDAVCDFQAFSYLIQKYTVMRLHQVDSDQKSDQLSAIDKLIHISHVDLDMTVIGCFYNNVLEHAVDKVGNLAMMIPDTRQGNALTQQLFGCTAAELDREPKRKAILPTTLGNASLLNENLPDMNEARGSDKNEEKNANRQGDQRLKMFQWGVTHAEPKVGSMKATTSETSNKKFK